MSDRHSSGRRRRGSGTGERRRYEPKKSREARTVLESARKHAHQKGSERDRSISLEDDGIEVKWGRPNMRNYKKIINFHLGRSYVIVHGMFPYDSWVKPGIKTALENDCITVVAVADDSCLKDFLFVGDRILALNEHRMTDNSNFQLIMSNYHGHFEMLIERLKELPQKKKSYREIPIKLDGSDDETTEGKGAPAKHPSKSPKIAVTSHRVRVKQVVTSQLAKSLKSQENPTFNPQVLKREIEILTGKSVSESTSKKKTPLNRFARLKKTFEKAKRKQRKLFGTASYHRKSTRLEKVTMSNFPKKQAKLIAAMKKAPLPLDIQQVLENRLLLLTTQLKQAALLAESSQSIKEAEQSSSQTISSDEAPPTRGVEVSRDVEHHQIQSDVSRKKKLKRVGR